jgi:hypothetical protein
MNEAIVFNGGLPYGPDVNRLKEAFPISKLTEGVIISHEELEKIVRQKRGTQRYYGVVNSWMGQQKNEHGLFLVWEPTAGVKVLDPAAIFHYGEARMRQKGKQLGRAVRILGHVDRTRLDEIGQKRFDQVTRVGHAIKTAVDDARKQLAIELGPVKSLPKPQMAAAK